MTIDEAIEYYTKAADQRELADKEKGDYDKWNETRFMTKKQSAQEMADNRQLAAWLKELKVSEMNDKFISKDVECYTKKLEKENKVLKDFLRQIAECFDYHGKNETDNDRLNKIINIIRCYEKLFREEAP